jgi:hypothetical protein
MQSKTPAVEQKPWTINHQQDATAHSAEPPGVQPATHFGTTIATSALINAFS